MSYRGVGGSAVVVLIAPRLLGTFMVRFVGERRLIGWSVFGLFCIPCQLISGWVSASFVFLFCLFYHCFLSSYLPSRRCGSRFLGCFFNFLSSPSSSLSSIPCLSFSFCHTSFLFRHLCSFFSVSIAFKIKQ